MPILSPKSQCGFLLRPTSQRDSTTISQYSFEPGPPACHMNTLNTITSAGASTSRMSEDALQILGRVADAFDNPGSLHKADKEVLFVVNVVKSRRLLSSLSSEESVCGDDSSVEGSYEEDMELVELGDVSIWEHASSYPYASRGHASPRSFSERFFRQDDGTYDVTKMLLTSSPLDRLDRLARIELKKTGWFERTDKWSVVQLGLPAMDLPVTHPKRPSKNTGGSRFFPNKMTSPDVAKRRSDCPRQERGQDAPRRERDGGGTRPSTPKLIWSPKRSQGADLLDCSTLSYADASRLSDRSATTPKQGRRTPPRPTRGRLGQVVRDFVKRMLPPSSGGGSGGYARTRHTEMTPRSEASGDSGWTVASVGSCKETNRWSGFWQS